MKKILVTGAGGFIGSHLAELCVEYGYDVKAFVHYNSINNWGWLEYSKYKHEMEIILGDIRDYDSVYKALHNSDTIFHLAALIGIPYSYTTPLAYIRTNIQGTYNILESAKQSNAENILITSTSETYGTAQYVPIDEKHPLVGQSPYSASKIGADQLAVSYYKSFGLPVKIVRPFNTFGPRQSARAIIPSVISQILSGQDKLQLGNLLPTRDFTYVKDTITGFLEIEKSNGLYGEFINIGMGDEISIGDLINLIISLMNTEIKILVTDERVRPGNSEVNRLFSDNNKLLKTTNWKPSYTLKEGLVETIDFIKHYIHLYKPEIYNV